MTSIILIGLAIAAVVIHVASLNRMQADIDETWNQVIKGVARWQLDELRASVDKDIAALRSDLEIVHGQAVSYEELNRLETAIGHAFGEVAEKLSKS